MRTPITSDDLKSSFNKFSKYIGRNWPNEKLSFHSARERTAQIFGYNSVHELNSVAKSVKQFREINLEKLISGSVVRLMFKFDMNFYDAAQLLLKAPYNELKLYSHVNEDPRKSEFYLAPAYSEEIKARPKCVPSAHYCVRESDRSVFFNPVYEVISSQLGDVSEILYETNEIIDLDKFYNDHVEGLIWKPLKESLKFLDSRFLDKENYAYRCPKNHTILKIHDKDEQLTSPNPFHNLLSAPGRFLGYAIKHDIYGYIPYLFATEDDLLAALESLFLNEPIKFGKEPNLPSTFVYSYVPQSMLRTCLRDILFIGVNTSKFDKITVSGAEYLSNPEDCVGYKAIKKYFSFFSSPLISNAGFSYCQELYDSRQKFEDNSHLKTHRDYTIVKDHLRIERNIIPLGNHAINLISRLSESEVLRALNFLIPNEKVDREYVCNWLYKEDGPAFFEEFGDEVTETIYQGAAKVMEECPQLESYLSTTAMFDLFVQVWDKDCEDYKEYMLSHVAALAISVDSYICEVHSDDIMSAFGSLVFLEAVRLSGENQHDLMNKAQLKEQSENLLRDLILYDSQYHIVNSLLEKLEIENEVVPEGYLSWSGEVN